MGAGVVTMIRKLREAHLRHSTYFKGVLANADELFVRGRISDQKIALTMVQREWPNIAAGQDRARMYSTDDDIAATLCFLYTSAGAHVLDVLQNPHQHISWLQESLRAARCLGRKDYEEVTLGNIGNVYVEMGEPDQAAPFLPAGYEVGARYWRQESLGI
jgi:hypothetical protein